MKILSFILIGSLFCLNILAEEPGFHKWDSPKIPAIIQEKAKSVFRIYFVERSVASYLKPEEIGKAFFEVLLNKKIDPTKKMLFIKIFQLCLEQRTEKCPDLRLSEFNTIPIGSAYLIEEDVLETAAHNIESSLEKIRGKLAPVTPNGEFDLNRLDFRKHYQAFILEKFQPTLVIMNEKNKIVYETLISKNTAKITYFQDHIVFQSENPGRKTYPLMIDRIHIQLDKPLKSPFLKTAPASKEPLEEVFILGAPRANLGRAGDLNSNGLNMYVSVGKEIGLEKALKILKENHLKYTEDFFKSSHYLFVSNDVDLGNSGGPCLNSQGEVVGSIVGIQPKIEYKDLKQVPHPPYFSMCLKKN